MKDKKGLDALIDRAQQAIHNANVVFKVENRNNKETAKPLTTKERKSLKSATFCGPNRSFPTPDCKHIASAKAFLNRSKFSKATKQKIAACINRRSKQLKCAEGKPAKAKGSFNEELCMYEEISFIQLSYEEKKVYASDVFAYTKAIVDMSVKDPGHDLDYYIDKVKDNS